MSNFNVVTQVFLKESRLAVSLNILIEMCLERMGDDEKAFLKEFDRKRRAYKSVNRQGVV